MIAFGGDVAASSEAVTFEATDLDAAGSDAIEVYVVQSGDTLWDIASSIAMPGEDVRPLVDELRVLAGGSSLEIGQRLIIDHTMIRS